MKIFSYGVVGGLAGEAPEEERPGVVGWVVGGVVGGGGCGG